MAALPYIQLYVADYLGDTYYLTTEEHGAYLLLIMTYWQSGKPIHKSRLARAARMTNERWTDVERTLNEFFVEDENGYWVHERIEEDLKRVAERGASDSLTGASWKGYVYFIATKNMKTVKIGYSKNPWARLKDLQMSSSEKLLLVATVKTTVVNEKKLHAELKEYQVKGEWFECSTLVKSLINAIKSKEITTVEESVNYCSRYRTATVATTKDTYTDTYTDINIKEKDLCNSEQLNLFDLFWDNYPRKQDKKKSRVAFKRLNKSQKQLAIDDCKTRYANTEKQFIPLATTYIHGERWEDEQHKTDQQRGDKHNGFSDRDYSSGATSTKSLAWFDESLK